MAHLGLDGVGIDATRRCVAVDGRLQATRSGLYAAGDVVGLPYGALTHAGRRMGVSAAENALSLDPHDVDPDWRPTAIFTNPEVASAGLTETAAREGARRRRRHRHLHGRQGPRLGRGARHGQGDRRPSVPPAAWSPRPRLPRRRSDPPARRGDERAGRYGDPVLATEHIHPTLGEVVRSAMRRAVS